MSWGKILLAIVLCLAASTIPPRATVAADESEQPRRAEIALAEVSAVNAEFWEAFAARDLWSMGRLWDKGDNASAIFPVASAPLFGWENVRESFKRSFAHNRDIKIESRSISVQVEGNAAWLVDAVRLEAMQTQTGQSILVDPMLSTKIFLENDGRWRVVHFHAHVPDFTIPNVTQHLPTSTSTPLRQPSDEVERTSAAFYEAFANHDLAAMLRVWSSGDVSVIHPSNRTSFVGRDQVAASWERAFSDLDTLQVKPRTTVKKAWGSVAWLVDANEFHAVSANMGSTMHLHNVLSTQIFTKRSGQWLMAHYHGQIGFAFDHAD